MFEKEYLEDPTFSGKAIVALACGKIKNLTFSVLPCQRLDLFSAYFGSRSILNLSCKGQRSTLAPNSAPTILSTGPEFSGK